MSKDNKILKQLEEIEKIIDDMSPEELRKLYDESIKNRSNPEQYAKIKKEILEETATCELCGKEEPIDQIEFMSGMDYQYYAATNVYKDCL